jgi:hypothetical protein
MTCRSPLIHVEVDSMIPLASLSRILLMYKPTWNQWTSPNLLSTRDALHHSGEVSSRTSHNNRSKASSQTSWRAQRSTTSKPSRRRQPPRVTSRWRLLEELLVPQCSNYQCNALGSLNLTKKAILKACEWERVKRVLQRVFQVFKMCKRTSTRWGVEYIERGTKNLTVMFKSRAHCVFADSPPLRGRTVRRSYPTAICQIKACQSRQFSYSNFKAYFSLIVQTRSPICMHVKDLSKVALDSRQAKEIDPSW